MRNSLLIKFILVCIFIPLSFFSSVGCGLYITILNHLIWRLMWGSYWLIILNIIVYFSIENISRLRRYISLWFYSSLSLSFLWGKKGSQKPRMNIKQKKVVLLNCLNWSKISANKGKKASEIRKKNWFCRENVTIPCHLTPYFVVPNFTLCSLI